MPVLDPASVNIRFPVATVLGSQVHFASLTQALQLVQLWVREHRQHRAACRQIVVTGFHGLWHAHRDANYRGIVSQADLWLPDGIAPVWAARLRGLTGVGRVPGLDLLNGLLGATCTPPLRSYFYGTTDAVLRRIAVRVRERFPDHLFAGSYAPPFRPMSSAETEAVLAGINASRADLLWVALGMPKQDEWIARHRDRLDVGVAVGIGAAFEFLSGDVRRAPDLVGRAGLEWLWRLGCEPRKLWKRDLIQGPLFLRAMLGDLLRGASGAVSTRTITIESPPGARS